MPKHRYIMRDQAHNFVTELMREEHDDSLATWPHLLVAAVIFALYLIAAL